MVRNYGRETKENILFTRLKWSQDILVFIRLPLVSNRQRLTIFVSPILLGKEHVFAVKINLKNADVIREEASPSVLSNLHVGTQNLWRWIPSPPGGTRHGKVDNSPYSAPHWTCTDKYLGNFQRLKDKNTNDLWAIHLVPITSTTTFILSIPFPLSVLTWLNDGYTSISLWHNIFSYSGNLSSYFVLQEDLCVIRHSGLILALLREGWHSHYSRDDPVPEGAPSYRHIYVSTGYTDQF